MFVIISYKIQAFLTQGSPINFYTSIHIINISSTFPPGSVVLVTGVNGYIGSHVADQLLQAGFNLWEDKFGKDRVELVVVRDFSAPGAFDSAAQAAKTPTVRNLVYTSSTAALAPPTPNAPPPYLPGRAMSVYAASKVEGEKALFKYAKEKQPHFTVNSIVLGVNFGKVLDWSIPVSSGSFVKEIFNGQPERAKHLDYHVFDINQHYRMVVDVQDTARLHVGALTDPAISNERIISYATHFTWNDVLDHLLCNDSGTALLKALGRPGWTSLEDSLKLNLRGL
ncbi:hypothetical protein EDB81DRAFT_844390 [Dactylonectria macrodidyma]|uniref:NAD-dependent epimerase/dehydratase domain-containing protein n=1 Tax=Dactylonectria macrodidyma TaxID=307937 RepID=A0A9P9EEU7_9HYPO|nr:hypothetical protein EDB81DRAFT_844390 [Dactylonectria macrodidyma]